jgi:hypothetical protein
VICAVHALVGGAVGRLAGKRPGAFAAGVATHLLGDLLPHKDLDPKIEAPLLAATLALLAWRLGVTSPEFVGAAGGVAPDVENAAYVTGLMPVGMLHFPTHIGGGTYHGPRTRSVWPQGVLAAVCLAYLLRRRPSGR